MSGRGGLVLGMAVVLGVGCGDANRERAAFGAGGSPAASGAGGATAGGGGAAGTAPSTKSPLPFVFPGASFAPGSVCEATGWCWYDPLPSGAWWQGVAGAGRTDLWIGGISNTVLRSAAGRWSALASPLSDTEGIWAASTDDVWLGGVSQPGIAAIAHWDGQALTLTTEVGAGEINDVWGSGATDVYAVGFGTAQHWNGTAWTTVPGIVGGSVSGSGPDDVWVAASNGLQHFDGTTWSRVAQLEGNFVQSVAVAGRNDVWVASLHDGVQDVEHFDGTTWTVSLHLEGIGTSHVSLTGVGTGANGDVWAVGTQFDTADERGYLAHFDGAAWTVAAESPTPLFRARAADGIGVVAVGRDGGLLLLTAGSPPTFTDLRSGPAENLTGVWGSSPTDVWAVGRAGTVLHFDGSKVTAIPSGVTTDLTDVWGTSADDVWIVGRGGTALHFDGASLSEVATGTTADLLAVFTATPGDVWMGGDGSTLLRRSGAGFESVSLAGLGGPFAVFDLHGLSSSDVWLSGGAEEGGIGFAEPGFTAHFDGTAWSAATILTLNSGGFPVRRIWELAPNDVWALTQPLFRDLVGFWHFDGTSWADRTMPVSPETFMFPNPGDALGSFVFGPHDRWLVGVLGAWERNTQ